MAHKHGSYKINIKHKADQLNVYSESHSRHPDCSQAIGADLQILPRINGRRGRIL